MSVAVARVQGLAEIGGSLLPHQVGLKAELDAIDAWDENYQRDRTHSAIGEVAYSVRQDRRREIMTELTNSG